MSDLDEVPHLTPEAKAFLNRHATTGEPSADEFNAARARFLSPSRAVSASAVPAPAKRSWGLRHEVLAAAAVLLVLVGAQGLYLSLHVAPTASAEMKAVVEAYRAGDLEGAHRLASQSCGDAACKPLASSLSRALGLANRLDSLSSPELEQLAALDTQLSGGTETTLGLRIAQRRKGAPVQPPVGDSLVLAEQLFKEGSELKQAHNYEQAVLRLEKCVVVAPGYHPCYRMLGSVFAFIAGRDGSVSDMEKARAYYERFLELAPPDDGYVPKVRAILDAARENEPPPKAKDQPVLSLGGTQPVEPPRNSAHVDLAVQARFRDGNTTAALAMAEDCASTNAQCHALATEIKEFETKSQHLETLNEGELIMLYDLNLRISGGVPGARGDAIHAQLVSTLALKASQAKLTGNWPRVVQLASRVLQLDPQHQDARVLMDDARNQARDLYLRAYQLRDSDPAEALSLFKEVMTLAPPNDEMHQKAKARVSELQSVSGTSDEGADPQANIVVALHGTRDLTFTQNIMRVAIGDPGIADVSVTGARTLRVMGVAPGKTTLLTWLVNGQREAKLIMVR